MRVERSDTTQGRFAIIYVEEHEYTCILVNSFYNRSTGRLMEPEILCPPFGKPDIVDAKKFLEALDEAIKIAEEIKGGTNANIIHDKS